MHNNSYQKPNLRHNKREVKGLGRTAGNSRSCGDDGRCQDWYKLRELEGESSRF